MQFIETARQLEAHTLACCMKAPKRYSFLLTQRIMETASEVHDHVRAANNIWPTNQHEAQLRRDELARTHEARKQLAGATKDGQILQQTICVIAQIGGTECTKSERTTRCWR